jgi:hypothetical protein
LQSECHRPQAQPGDLQAGPAQSGVIHEGTLPAQAEQGNSFPRATRRHHAGVMDRRLSRCTRRPSRRDGGMAGAAPRRTTRSPLDGRRPFPAARLPGWSAARADPGSSLLARPRHRRASRVRPPRRWPSGPAISRQARRGSHPSTPRSADGAYPAARSPGHRARFRRDPGTTTPDRRREPW